VKVLISGTNSGLGKWLAKQFSDCDKYTRDTDWLNLKDEYDLIIHCAAAITHNGWDKVEFDLFKDNVFLTRDLVNIPHTKFVYISSIDEAKNVSLCAYKDYYKDDNHLTMFQENYDLVKICTSSEDSRLKNKFAIPSIKHTF